MAALTIRATQEGVSGLRIVGGGLSDADSKVKLPDTAFDLVQLQSGTDVCEKEFAPVAAETVIPASDLTRIYIRLRKDWVRAGSYAGDLLLTAKGDTGAQTVPLKVFVRPRQAWIYGLTSIFVGTLLSWGSTVWLVRRRQLAGNELLIARLDGLLDSLRTRLQDMARAGAPQAQATLAYIAAIRRNKLPQLVDDKALAVIAGVTVPSTGDFTVLEEIEGVTRVVQDGFGELLKLRQDHPDQVSILNPYFAKMDNQGGGPVKKAILEAAVTEIINAAKEALTRTMGSGAPRNLTASYALPDLRQEAAVVQRLMRTTYWLDAISIATVVGVGMYVLVWRNPGFGSVGDLLVAFGWGLGLKLSTDTTRLTPSEVRTTVGVRIPSP